MSYLYQNLFQQKGEEHMTDTVIGQPSRLVDGGKRSRIYAVEYTRRPDGRWNRWELLLASTLDLNLHYEYPWKGGKDWKVWVVTEVSSKAKPHLNLN